MINMFKAELYRVVKTKGFFLFWGLSVFTFMVSVIYHNSGGISLGAPLDFDESVKMDIRQTASNLSYYFYLIFPAFSIIAGEFSEHTVKNTITSAVSKRDYFIGKYAFTMLYSLLSLTVANYLFYFINRLVNGSKYSSSFAAFSKAFFGQLPVFAAVVSVFVFLAFLLKKGAAFNAVVIITPIIYTSVLMVLYGIKSTVKIAGKMLNYEISMMISKLAVGCSNSYRLTCYGAYAVLIALTFAFGLMIWNKREID